VVGSVGPSVFFWFPYTSDSLEGIASVLISDLIDGILTPWGTVAVLSFGLVIFWIVYSWSRKQNRKIGIKYPQTRPPINLRDKQIEDGYFCTLESNDVQPEMFAD